MTTLNQLTDFTLRKLQAYGLSQPRAAFLTQPMDETSLVLTVSSSANFGQGLAEIESELVFIETVDDDNNTITLSPDGRGYYGTEAAAHDVNTRVTASPVWPRIDVEAVLNEAIIGTYPVLFGVGVATFNANPVVMTYEMPADCESILKVTADTIGPDNAQQNVKRWSYDSTASSEFTTGNVLTIYESIFPGRVVTVNYIKQPVGIAPADELTTSGLRESAKTALVLWACSTLLYYIDPSRLPVESAQADEYDTRNAVGTAQKIANTLYTRYEMELDLERRRLRETYKVPFHVRSR